MSARYLIAPVALLLAGGIVGEVRRAPADPVTTTVTAAEQNATSTLDDQTELAVTVYNSDIALVRDVRTLSSRAARRICTSWTSRRRSIPRPCTSDRSPSRRA